VLDVHKNMLLYRQLRRSVSSDCNIKRNNFASINDHTKISEVSTPINSVRSKEHIQALNKTYIEAIPVDRRKNATDHSSHYIANMTWEQTLTSIKHMIHSETPLNLFCPNASYNAEAVVQPEEDMTQRRKTKCNDIGLWSFELVPEPIIHPCEIRTCTQRIRYKHMINKCVVT
jgi:hypothetical protein